MTPAPLSMVLEEVARLMNKALPRDRAEVLSKINGARQLLWRNEAFRLSYFKARGCARAEHFQRYCRNCSPLPSGSVGVVLPPHVMNPTELMADFVSFNITSGQIIPVCWPWSQWRSMRGDERPRAERMPPRLLERDIPSVCGDSRRVSFRSDADCDCGRPVGVRYTDLNGREKREDLILSTTPVLTSVSVGEFLEITFPQRSGWIVVETEDGHPLGRYHPSIYVPQHEWFQLEILCPNVNIQWRAQKEPTRLVFDTDMVEFSDGPMWELALKVLEYQPRTNLTSTEQSNMARIYEALGRVSDADMDAKKKNFVTAAVPASSQASLATARAFAGPGNRRGVVPWTRW